MNRKLEQALDTCLDRMHSGASLDDCLERFPDFSQELRPLLNTAFNVRQVETPRSSQAAIVRSRQGMFAAVDRKFTNQPVSKSLLSRYAEQIIILITGKENLDMKLITRFAVAMIVAVIFISAGGTAIASAQAIPGDTLYPVKTLLEGVKLTLTLDDDSRQQLEERLQETRREEILAVLQAGRIADVHYWGELTAINENSWEVGGLIINLDADTQITGEPVLGSYVVVKATTQEDGTILAYVLMVKGPYSGAISPYPDPQGTNTQMWMRNHEQFRDGTHEPAYTPMPDHDQDQDRDRNQDKTNEPTHEPAQDQNRDQDHDQNCDQDCEPPQAPPPSQPKPGHGGGH